MKLLVALGLQKAPEPVVVKKRVYKRPPKITVITMNGERIVHYANFRRIDEKGMLSLFNHESGVRTVADYAPGTWYSVSVGTRKVSPK